MIRFTHVFSSTVCFSMLALLSTASLASANDPAQDDRENTGAQLFEGMGDWNRQFTTSSEESNKFLVQGFIWLQAFNHDEAIRSFQAGLMFRLLRRVASASSRLSDILTPYAPETGRL